MTLTHTYTLRDGKAWITEIDVEVECDVEVSGDSVGVDVTSLEVDGKNILESETPLIKALAEDMKSQIENDTDFASRAAEELGYECRYAGPGRYPEYRWV